MEPIGALKWACVLSGTMAAADIAGAADRDGNAERQERAGRPLIEEIHVTGARSGSATAPGIEEMRRQMSRIPGAVDLVGAEAFEDEYAENLKDMLAHTPGVFIQERYAEEVRFSIRGSGLSRGFHLRGVQLLLDGVPINFADGQGDFQEIDARLARYVAVYKGGNGFEYGAATLGGAVNVVTPTGGTARARNSLTVEGGSFATVRGTATLAREGGKGDAFLGVTAVRSDQFRAQSDQRTVRFTGNFGYAFNDRVETRFYLTANHIDQEVPGALSLQAALNTPKEAAAVNVANDHARDIRTIRFANKTSVHLGADRRLAVGAYMTYRDLDHPIFVFIDDEIFDTGAFARFTGSTTLAGHRHDITAGMTGQISHNNSDWFVNVGGDRGPRIAETGQDSHTFQAYANDQIALTDSLALDLGLQLMTTHRGFTDFFDPAQSDEEDFTSVNPKIGLLWDPTETVQVWANVTRAGEPPDFIDLTQRPVIGFVSLDEQTAWTAEIGSRGRYGAVAWDVALYRSWIDGELLQFTLSQDIPATTFNAEDTIHQGLELGLHITLADSLVAGAKDRLVLSNSYTLNDFSFDDDRQFGDNALPVIPRHVYQGALRYEREEQFHAALSLEWVPKGPWADFANTLRATDYALLSASAGIALGEGWTLYVDVKNLTDKAYVSNVLSVTEASAPGTNLDIFWPGEGLSAFAGLRTEF